MALLLSGDLVVANGLRRNVTLHSVPFDPKTPWRGRKASNMTPFDVALVVSCNGMNNEQLFIIGPHGCGWVSSAYFTKVRV